MARIRARGYLIAGVDQNTYHFGYLDPLNSKIEGFDIDMVRAIAAAIFGNPDKVVYKAISDAQRIPDIQSGAVDIVAHTMTINCQRLKKVDFSTVYFDAGQRVLVEADSRVRNLNQLGGQKVCATTDSTSLTNIRAAYKGKPPAPIPVAVTYWTDCLVLLQQGQVAAISTDDSILAGLAAQDPWTRIVGPRFSNEPYGLAISKLHPDFVRFVNAVLAQLRSDGGPGQEDGQPGLAEGFCRHCGTPFSFTPKLDSGNLIGGQYEVLGCLAHGGLGWIYLARDRNVSDSWRVLKGLLSTGDSGAMAAAVAERQFLAAVDHPNIVRIYNFVQHEDPRSGEMAGYIVMEYVGGRSLRQILLDERKAGRSVPVEHALAYAIEVVRALGYLHSRGLVYCDLKPDNVIQSEEMLKLIDMGAVRRIDDEDGPIYGTVGYQAPEIATDGPSPSSDLHTVGRMLAVLTFEFTGYTSTYKHSLPTPETVPLLAQHESFYRLLRRATSPDPGRRFASAAQMSEQLTGVLREVLATGDGNPRPALSALFSPEVQAAGADPTAGNGDAVLDSPTPPPAALIAAALPVPQVDSADPAASFVATVSTLDPAARTAALSAAARGAAGTPPAVARSVETQLALVRVQIATHELDAAAGTLNELASTAWADWRVTWYQGLRALAAGEPAVAQAVFSSVYDELPGELAPQLALAFTAEAAGDTGTAARFRAGMDSGPFLCQRSVRAG